MSTSTDSKYSTTCLVSTLVSTHSWLVSTLHSFPSSCTLCQPVLTVSTSDKKYRFGVPFKVLTYVRMYLLISKLDYNKYSHRLREYRLSMVQCTHTYKADWTLFSLVIVIIIIIIIIKLILTMMLMLAVFESSRIYAVGQREICTIECLCL